MLEKTPHTSEEDLLEAFNSMQNSNELASFVNKINEEYLYWNKVKYKKSPDGCTPQQLWAKVVCTRIMNEVKVPEWIEYNIHFGLTNMMQRLCHEFDMNFGGSWGNDTILKSEDQKRYLVSSLMEEAISSSQMEGASTTRKQAKEMLRKNQQPKDKSQQMIFNNYQTICFIVDHKDEPLTIDYLLHIHSLMTEKTLTDPDDSGKFRTNDDVVVVDDTKNEVVHTPPSFQEVPQFAEKLCSFFNDNNSENYIHPVIRGIILHFIIAYVHPFVDGNGRTARAIFYWYMLRQGYWLTQYMSISRIIYKKKSAYEKSYLYAESDKNDIGYFVTYNLNVLKEAFSELQIYLKRKEEERQSVRSFMRIEGLNQRQAAIIKMFYDNPSEMITVKDLEIKFSITPTTAKSDIVALVKLNYLEEISVNKVKKAYIRGVQFDTILSNALKIGKD